MLKGLKEKRKLILYAGLSIVWTLFIFSFSIQSGEESSQLSGGLISMLVGVIVPSDFAYIGQLEFGIRKLAHFTEYFILGVLVIQTMRQTHYSKSRIIAVLICLLVASCDETIQLFSGGRSGKITDVVLDSVGSWCGIIVSLKVRLKAEWIIANEKR